jgi:hypothetical protein
MRPDGVVPEALAQFQVPAQLAILLATPLPRHRDARKDRIAVARYLAAPIPIFAECTVMNPNTARRSPAERLVAVADFLRGNHRYQAWICTNSRLRSFDRCVLPGHVAWPAGVWADDVTNVRLGVRDESGNVEWLPVNTLLEIPFGARPVFDPRRIRIHYA